MTGRTYGWKATLALTGATQRQLDYWTRRGWLYGSRPGSGRTRQWPEPEVAVGRLMVRLIRAGLTTETAAATARRRAPHDLSTDPATVVDLGDGVTLRIGGHPTATWPAHAEHPLWTFPPPSTTWPDPCPLRPITDPALADDHTDPWPDPDGDYLAAAQTGAARP